MDLDLDNKYDEKYFEWQRTVGEFGGKANLFKFEPYLPTAPKTILDFGCGGGFLLKEIKDLHPDIDKVIGVEINPSARSVAQDNGVTVYEKLELIKANSVDVIISNHALEHTEEPLKVLKQFRRILKPEGKIIVVVPHEYSTKCPKNEVNMHLYTWSPLALSNLFKVAGLTPIKADSICNAWMPHYQFVQKVFGWTIFRKLCTVYALFKSITRHNVLQTRVVATK